MKSNLIKETTVAVLLIILLELILNPFHFWMPSMMLVSILVAAVVIFSLFASLILREKVSDEREGIHRMLAGRNAFLTGAIISIIGIVIQSFSHHVDPWLVITLVAMVIVKLATRMYSDGNY